MKRYNIIYADPPWKRDRWSDKAQFKSGEKHYPTMTIEELCALPVSELAEDNALLFMWVVGFELRGAMEVMKAWGFEYKTIAFNWVKTNADTSIFMGLGHWTRQNSEICLMGKRGKPKRVRADVMQVIIAPRMRHSKKPLEVRERIVNLAGDLPRVELFARGRVGGWDAWGNEVVSVLVMT
jgi:N6-adenosine-specific RNA methylase IME4